jgi:hypothetical protein
VVVRFFADRQRSAKGTVVQGVDEAELNLRDLTGAVGVGVRRSWAIVFVPTVAEARSPPPAAVLRLLAFIARVSPARESTTRRISPCNVFW